MSLDVLLAVLLVVVLRSSYPFSSVTSCIMILCEHNAKRNNYGRNVLNMEKRVFRRAFFFLSVLVVYMCAIQELLLAGWSQKAFSYKTFLILLLYGRCSLVFFSGCIPIVCHSSLKFKVNKQLLILFIVLAATQGFTILLFRINGLIFVDTEYITYSYLLLLFASAITMIPQQVISRVAITVIALGYIVNMVMSILMSTLFRLHYDSYPQKPPAIPFFILYVFSFVVLGFDIGRLSFQQYPSLRKEVTMILLSIIVSVYGVLYIGYRLFVLLTYSIENTPNILILFRNWLLWPTLRYQGFIQVILFLCGWHIAVLYFVFAKRNDRST